MPGDLDAAAATAAAEDLIVVEDRFALRFLDTADVLPTKGTIDMEMLDVYHLRDGQVSEFRLQANVDFDCEANA